jgi:hypothetical protein
MKLSFGARLMFRGMIDHADDDGFFEADPSELKAAIFPADAISVTDALRLRDEVVRVGMARLHLVDDEEYIELPKYQKYQQTRKDLYRPSEIKADIELAKSNSSRRYECVTDQSRTRHTNRLDRVNREEQEIKSFPASLGVDNSNSESTKVTQSKEPGLAQQINQEDVGDVLTHWSRRFPNSEMKESLAQKILTVCQDRENWRDPRWLIDQVNIKAENPIAYLTVLLRKVPLPQPADGERAYWSWDRWQNRPREAPVGNSMGSVLKSMAKAAP